MKVYTKPDVEMVEMKFLEAIMSDEGVIGPSTEDGFEDW